MRLKRSLVSMCILVALTAASMLARCKGGLPPLSPPSLAHPLGVDPVGTDALCRLVKGVANTMAAAVTAYAAMLVIGVIAALASFYTKLGTASRITSRMFTMLPRFALIAFIAAYATLSPPTVGLLIGSLYGAQAFNAIYSDARRVTLTPMFEAAIAIGATRIRLAVRYLLPTITPRISRHASLAASIAVVATAGLSMIGVLPATTPTIGTLAYLDMVTPSSFYTLAGLSQLASFALTTVLLSYLVYNAGTILVEYGETIVASTATLS